MTKRKQCNSPVHRKLLYSALWIIPYVLGSVSTSDFSWPALILFFLIVGAIILVWGTMLDVYGETDYSS